jgi:hypothetical protein
MTAATRIYAVRKRLPRVGEPATETRLVRAPNAAQALRFVAADTLTVAVAGQDDLVELVAGGVKVEEAGPQTEAR